MSEWIRVKNILPELEGKVLTYSKRYGIKFNYRSINYNGWANHDAKERITHWMPLPEKPNE